MSENAPPENNPAGNNGAQPADQESKPEVTTNEPETAADTPPQEPTPNDSTVEQTPVAATEEQPDTNGTPTLVDSGVQTTESMPPDVSNGSRPVEETEVQATSSISVEPDTRPSVLIVGGLGMKFK